MFSPENTCLKYTDISRFPMTVNPVIFVFVIYFYIKKKKRKYSEIIACFVITCWKNSCNPSPPLYDMRFIVPVLPRPLCVDVWINTGSTRDWPGHDLDVWLLLSGLWTHKKNNQYRDSTIRPMCIHKIDCKKRLGAWNLWPHLHMDLVKNQKKDKSTTGMFGFKGLQPRHGPLTVR